MTNLVGREREIAENCALLRREDVRLITLTGPGGVGKTRLAVQVAREVAPDIADGAIFVPLAATHDAELVPTAIASAMGIPEVVGRQMADVLVGYLHDRELLLVLDNFEQILAAAPAVATLLQRCPRLKALVTSRARLLVSGEHDIPVAPLDLPDVGDSPSADTLNAFPATRLFLDRAAGPVTDADAPVVAEICRRLDGIPLAIELAAARTRVLPLRDLLARLEPRLPILTGGPRDLPHRLQTMRDAIAWSYDLLTPDEQTYFRRLAVFVGGFTLDAAEAAARDEGRGTTSHSPRPSSLELLSSLVDKSLVRQQQGPAGEARFRMLETIREFGLEQLVARGEEDEARAGHAAWCLDFASQVDADLEGPEMFRWLLRVEAEHANLRAAIVWYKARGDTASALRLGAGLSAFWWYRGHYREGREQLEALLDLPGAREHHLAWARAMTGLATLHYKSGNELPRVAGMHEEAVAVWRGIGDRERLCYALWCQGLALGGTDDEQAVAVLTEARGIAQGLGTPWLMAPCDFAMTRILRLHGDLQAAEALGSRVLQLAQEMGHPIGISLSLVALGHVALDRGDVPLAAARIRECLEYLSDLGRRWGTAGRLKGIAAVAAAPWGIPASLEGLAAAAVKWGAPARGARLFGASAVLREIAGYGMEPVDRPGFERWMAETQAQLGEANFTEAWAEGRSLTVDDAVAEALAIAAFILDDGRPAAREAPAAVMGDDR